MITGSVICGVDDSRGARVAVRVARGLSERLGLRLVLLHVVRPTRSVPRGMPFGQGETRADELRDAARVLREVAEELELEGRAEHLLQLGDPAERLVEVAGEQNAVMVVVGSRGRGGLRSALLGSVSAGLVARAPCPVVVVPPGAAKIGRDARR